MNELIWLSVATMVVGYILGIYVGRHYKEFTEE